MLEKSYNPQSFEQELYKSWEAKGFFAPKFQGKPYCIMLPPPNVTGSLHMGHGFQTSIMDALIRYHRMCGDNTLWQGGLDHAGISTQMVVENQLRAKGISRRDLGRKKFEQKIWEWKQQSGDTILRQQRRMGASLDWNRTSFTMDDDFSLAVKKVFIQLYDEKLIYRGKRLINWDPVLQTAVSDLEVINQEEQGFLWHVRYPLVGSEEFIVVATTRPETMLGDVAVAVNPTDKRYKKLIGKKVMLPLTNREIPIIADDYVDVKFGTGCVKITPAHDFNDYQVGKRHNLEMINIFTVDAKINQHAPSIYQNLDRFAAREKIVADLKDLGLLEKIEKYKVNVPRGDKTNAVIEPFLTEQWFVKIEPLAKPAIKAVEDGEIKFVPENWTKTYFQWLNNIEDWCISRQLWWGHRIPAWYDQEGNIYVGDDEAAVRKKYHLPTTLALKQDEDVLDTWFSSGLWPFVTLGWPEQTKELKSFYPTSVLVTGFDIIFFWVARMVMFGLKFTGQVPFKEVYITGLVRDSHGQKMSKSKGNVLDPIDLIDGIDLDSLVSKRTYGMMQPEMAKEIAQHTREEFPQGIAAHGTDALRFTYCSLATTGRDVKFDLGRLEGHRNFCNKIWNATRYVMMNAGTTLGLSVNVGQPEGCSYDTKINVIDRWILSRLEKVTAEVHQHFTNYRFDLLSQALHEFIWHEYCDWYLELSKVILTDENTSAELKLGTQHTLLSVLEVSLRLLHPLMPFITEKLWQSIAPLLEINGETIMLQPYPFSAEVYTDKKVENEIKWLQSVVLALRNIRGEMNIAPSKQIPLLINKFTKAEQTRWKKYALFLSKLAKIESVTWLKEGETIPPAATALVKNMELLVPLAGLIDREGEIERLQKEIAKLEKNLAIARAKLANEKFVANAPKAVVEEERKREKEFETALMQLKNKIDSL